MIDKLEFEIEIISRFLKVLEQDSQRIKEILSKDLTEKERKEVLEYLESNQFLFEVEQENLIKLIEKQEALIGEKSAGGVEEWY